MEASTRIKADLACGLLLLAIASFSLWVNAELEFGSARDIGPGYFPVLISWAIAILSVIMIIRGLVVKGDRIEPLDGRPILFILVSFIAFAILIRPAGLIAAIFAQVALAHFACRDARLLESLLIGAGLALFSSIVFVRLLKLPVALLP